MFSLLCFTGIIIGLLVLDIKKVINICKLKDSGQSFLKKKMGI